MINELTGKQYGGSIHRLQSGGSIPGFGGGDTEPALLEKGEYVINKHSAKNNRQLLDAVNAGRVQRLQYGGIAGIQYAARGGSQYVDTAEILAAIRPGTSGVRTDAQNQRMMGEFIRLLQTATDHLRELSDATGVTADSIRRAGEYVVNKHLLEAINAGKSIKVSSMRQLNPSLLTSDQGLWRMKYHISRTILQAI